MKNSYNTEVKPLILPEYGRNIQNMVDHCLTITDREERQKCAETIIQAMSFFSNKQKEREDYWQVLWDHLYIMSDFKLDINFPVQVTTKKEYEEKLDRKLNNDHQHKPTYRHYGRTIERMITAVIAEPDAEKRERMAKLTALQMKRNYVMWNKDTVANSKIFADLFELSKEAIYLDEITCQLPDVKDLFASSNNTQSNNHNNSNNKARKINIRRRPKR